MKPDEIVGIVLAGGRSSRIGGDDKCLQPLGGKPMLAYVLARLRLQVSDIVISPNSDRLAGFGAPVIVDNVSGFQGPLAGVEAPTYMDRRKPVLVFLRPSQFQATRRSSC